MDVQMPEMDGVEALREIRELEKSTDHSVNIIALTAHALVGDRENLLEQGFDSYLSKPLMANDLISALKRI
jgi:CheY-like chemotaxis protein